MSLKAKVKSPTFKTDKAARRYWKNYILQKVKSKARRIDTKRLHGWLVEPDPEKFILPKADTYCPCCHRPCEPSASGGSSDFRC